MTISDCSTGSVPANFGDDVEAVDVLGERAASVNATFTGCLRSSIRTMRP